MILSRILCFIFFIAIIDLITEVLKFVICYKNGEEFKIGVYRKFGLWASIAYIINIIIFGW